MINNRDPSWAKWLAAAVYCCAVIWLAVYPGVASIITLHYEGNLHGPTNDHPRFVMNGWDAFFIGLKFLFGGVVLLAIPAVLYWWVNKDD